MKNLRLEKIDDARSDFNTHFQILSQQIHSLKAEGGFFNENIPSSHAGYYKVDLRYTESTSGGIGIWTETLTKTGYVLADYSDYNRAIIGDATASGSFNGDGTGGYKPKDTNKAGNVYTWAWDDVNFMLGKEFIFLEDAT